MPTVAPIPRVERKNHTGYKRLWHVAESDIYYIPTPISGSILDPIELQPGKVFTEIPLDPEAGAFLTWEGSTSEGTTGYTYTLTAFLAGQSAAQRSAADTWDGIYSIYIGERMDGVHEVVGEIGRGLRLVINGENAGKPGSRVGLNLQGSMDYRDLPYEYSAGTIPT